jgi:hypothetical protein
MTNADTELLRLLARRLERLNVDSLWARRASGTRGNIIKLVAQIEAGEEIDSARLKPLIERAFKVLEHAAQEIPDIDDIKKKYQRQE